MAVKTCATGWIDSLAVRAINPFDFRAVGNGSAIDTTPLQNAVNTAIAQNLPLRIPVGTFIINSALTIASPLTVFGDDRYGSVIKQTGSASGIILSSSGNVVIRNLTLRGKNSSDSNQTGINGGGNQDCLVEDCIIEQWGGLGINFGNSTLRTTVRNNIIRNGFSEGIFFGVSGLDNLIESNIVYGNAKNGIDVNASRTVVRSNVCRNNGVSPDTTDTCGIIIGNSAGNPSSDNIVSDNICFENVQNGIFVWGAGTVQRFVVRGNVCNGTTDGWGINLTGGAGATFSGHAVSGNICRNNAAAGIVVNGVDDSLLVDNVLTGNVSHGLHFAGTNKSCARNIATGNIIRSNTSNGVQIDSANVTDALVSGNVVSGNSTNYNLTAGSRNTVFIGGNGSFTCTAAGTSTIADQNIMSPCRPMLFPTNAAAGLLMQTKSCNVGTVSDGSFTFSVSATAAGAPAGTETFGYTY